MGKFLGNDSKMSQYNKILNYTQLSGNWEKVTTEQKQAAKQLCEALKVIFALKDSDIYKHGEISGHKQKSEGDGIL